MAVFLKRVVKEAFLVQGEAEEGVDKTGQLEQFEGKFKDAVELATQKSAAVRVKTLDSICTVFL